jgi:hypothetical protein
MQTHSRSFKIMGWLRVGGEVTVKECLFLAHAGIRGSLSLVLAQTIATLASTDASGDVSTGLSGMSNSMAFLQNCVLMDSAILGTRAMMSKKQYNAHVINISPRVFAPAALAARQGRGSHVHCWLCPPDAHHQLAAVLATHYLPGAQQDQP